MKKTLKLIASIAMMNCFLGVASAQITRVEGAWEVDRSNERKLHNELDKFIAGIVAKASFETEEDKAAAPARIFSAFVGQKFWFRKGPNNWEQENEMNGRRHKSSVSIVATSNPNEFRIVKDGKEKFVISIDSDEKMTLTSIKEGISFPLIRQGEQ